MENLIGQSVGRYHILEQLGEGGMATVYKAYDTRLERDVAVKVIRVDQFAPVVLDRILQRFEREAKALAHLVHPNIVHVNDYGEQDGIPYLVMDYLPGGTLKRILGKPMPWQKSAELLLPIAEALNYAHLQGIIHRDVKPSNILLTQSGQPMLTDFGIAKILESDETTALTGTGVSVGTPEYMAPEQWIGQVSAQSDIYSLGVVFYEMITGRKPYMADTPPAIMLKQATEPLPRPTQYVSNLPEAVEKVLIKALAKKPENRYPDMVSFAGQLERLITGQIKADQSVTVADDQNTHVQEETNATRYQGVSQDGLPAKEPYPDKTTNQLTPPAKPGQPLPTNGGKRWMIPVGIIGGIVCIALAIIAGLILANSLSGNQGGQIQNPGVGGNVTEAPISSPSRAPVEPVTSAPLTQPTDTLIPAPALNIAGQWIITLSVSDAIQGDHPAGTCPTVNNVAYVFTFTQDSSGNLSGYYYLQSDPASGYSSAQYPFTGVLTGNKFSVTSNMPTKTDQCYGNINSWQGTILGDQMTGTKSLVQKGQGACCTYIGSFTGAGSQP